MLRLYLQTIVTCLYKLLLINFHLLTLNETQHYNKVTMHESVGCEVQNRTTALYSSPSFPRRFLERITTNKVSFQKTSRKCSQSASRGTTKIRSLEAQCRIHRMRNVSECMYCVTTRLQSVIFGTWEFLFDINIKSRSSENGWRRLAAPSSSSSCSLRRRLLQRVF